jgi:micrococcal nuclease
MVILMVVLSSISCSDSKYADFFEILNLGNRPTATLSATLFPPISTPTKTPGATSNLMSTLELIQTPIPSSTVTQTPFFTPTLNLTEVMLLPAAIQVSCIPNLSDYEEGKVVEVIDSETLWVDIAGEVHTVKYIGIDAPDIDEDLESRAKSKNSSLVAGRLVRLYKDVTEVDGDGRLYRYVFVDDTFVNYTMIRSGFAVPNSESPDTACDEVFNIAYQTALFNEVGLWIHPTPTPGRIRIVPTSASWVGGNCDPSYPDVCIPPWPPDLDCSQIRYRNFRVAPSDPHRLDDDWDGIGCEVP